jgi:hypothetical protein
VNRLRASVLQVSRDATGATDLGAEAFRARPFSLIPCEIANGCALIHVRLCCCSEGAPTLQTTSRRPFQAAVPGERDEKELPCPPQSTTHGIDGGRSSSYRKLQGSNVLQPCATKRAEIKMDGTGLGRCQKRVGCGPIPTAGRGGRRLWSFDGASGRSPALHAALRRAAPATALGGTTLARNGAGRETRERARGERKPHRQVEEWSRTTAPLNTTMSADTRQTASVPGSRRLS